MEQETLVKICMNGGAAKADLPTVPISVEDYEREIPAFMQMGVFDFHIHFRDGGGTDTLAQEAVEPQFRYLKERFPLCRIGIGSPLGPARTPALREKQVGAWTGWRPDYISLNICEERSLELGAILQAKAVPIEWGIFTMADARAFAAHRCAEAAFRVLIEIPSGSGDEQRAAAEEIYHFLHQRYPGLVYLLHGKGTGTWTVIRYAREHALPYRIGLEDTAVDETGRPLLTNLALYRHALELLCP